MKPNKINQELMLTVRVTQRLLDGINKLSRNKYSTRSQFIRDVLQKEVDKNR
jgi:metal-responsive CopG/Arc/MetJ family transcriptional regulator